MGSGQVGSSFRSGNQWIKRRARQLRQSIRRMSNVHLGLEPCEARHMMAVTQLVAIIPNEGAIIKENDVLKVAPSQLTLRFGDTASLAPSNVNITLQRAGGDGALGDGKDLTVIPGYIGQGDNPNEIVVRFAQSLPDDLYKLNISPAVGSLTTFTPVTRKFELDLGAQVIAVVPQPVGRDAQGKLTQQLDVIEVYFNDDQLSKASAENKLNYQLIQTGGTAISPTANNLDDVVVNPQSVSYTYTTIPAPTTTDPTAVRRESKAVLTFAPGVLTGYNGVFRLRVGNNDALPVAPVPPRLSVDNISVTEGNSGFKSAVFTVTLSAASGQAVTVNYATVNDTAAAPSDFTATSGTLTFAAGETSKKVTVLVKGDTVDEYTAGGAAFEQFKLQLSNPVGATIGTAQGVGKIYDNDDKNLLDPLFDPSFAIEDARATEGASGVPGSMVFTVHLLGPSLNNLSVQYRTIGGTATGNVDYASVPGSVIASNTLTFAAGETSQTITIPIYGNSVSDGDRTFFVQLFNPLDLFDASVVPLAASVATGTIVDDDGAAGSTIATAQDLGVLGSGSGLSGRVFSDRIRPTDYTIAFPGDLDSPGHRSVPAEAHGGQAGDISGGVPTQPFNFQDIYGVDPQNNLLHNLITEQQKNLVRQIFGFYSYYLGIQFIETPSSGFTIVTGDLRANDPTVTTGPGGVGGLAGTSAYTQLPTAIMDNAEQWDDKGPEGSSYFGVAMHEIGHLLGLGHAYDLPNLTVMGGAEDTGTIVSAAAAGENVYPGDGDIIHAQFLYRPDVLDVNMYKFTLGQSGTVDIETIAQRLKGAGGVDDPSFLDSVISVFDSNHNLIARNDNYFGRDSLVHLSLTSGQYYIGISAAGNTAYDPTIANSGIGGRSQGQYDLRINFTPTSSTGIVDTTNTLLDGDANGQAGGTYNFWFRANTSTSTTSVTNTLFVDKISSGGAGTTGSLAKPYTNLATALAAATPGQVVRIVGNAGADGDLSKPLDATAYNIGRDTLGQALSDGSKFEVPRGVTVMIDAGAVIKLSKANLDAGSSAVGVDRSGGAIQVLGTPGANVYLTSYYDTAIAKPASNLAASVRSGDWGGIVLRDDSDYETQGVFLNYINHANMQYGGGKVSVNGIESVYNPVHMITARPAVSFNSITRSADAAISANPNSFEESEFQDSSYNADYRRVGPELHGNDALNNSINGLFVRIDTQAGGNTEKLTVSARLNERDITYYLAQNLTIQGQPVPVSSTLVSGAAVHHAQLSGQLVIDPGVVIKIKNARIETLAGGQLLAEGTASNPIIFTALTDDRFGAGGTFDTNNDSSLPSSTQPIPTTPVGLWSGLYFGHLSSASLDHTLVTFAGGQSPIEGGFDQFDPVEIHQATVRIANSVFEGNANGQSTTSRVGRGDNEAAVIFVRGAQPVVLNNIIRFNNAPTMSINVNALNSNLVNDSGRQTGEIDLLGNFEANTGPLIRGNRQIGNSLNGMVVRGGQVTTGVVWDDTDMVHILRDLIVVPNFHENIGLRLQSSGTESLVVKLQDTSATDPAGFTAKGRDLDIDDRIGGTVQIVGTPNHPVVLTALADDTVGAGLTPTGKPLLDTNNDGAASVPLPGAWRSILLAPLSNDRNVEVIDEYEQGFTTAGDPNGLPGTSQFIGQLAPDLLNGDDNRRLGFEVHGVISQAYDGSVSPAKSGDVDVYSFKANGGTQVWLDLDRTAFKLDSVVELLDADGNVIARSNDSTAEFNALTNDALVQGGFIGTTGAGIARVLGSGPLSGPDRYTINPRDAGMRVVLPGSASQVGTYYVRVRANSANIDQFLQGASTGAYNLNVRLQEVDEVSGSTVRGADIRYATNGIELQGKPEHSPLLGELQETSSAHDSFANAQQLGNLLSQDRNVISVAGSITSAGAAGSNLALGEVDWYKFTVNYDLIQKITAAGADESSLPPKTWAAMFHISYADGAARPDLTISVYDAQGHLMYIGQDSDVADQQPIPGQDVNSADPTHGSFGTQDPTIGTVQLPEGMVNATTPRTYYVAISSNQKLPTVLNALYDDRVLGAPTNSLIRLQPVDSVRRVVEDHFDTGFGDFAGTLSTISVAGSPGQSLNLTPVDYTLGDTTLYVIRGGSIGTVDPYTGTILSQTGNQDEAWNNNRNDPNTDLAFRADGLLYSSAGITGGPTSGTIKRLATDDGATLQSTPLSIKRTIVGEGGIEVVDQSYFQADAITFWNDDPQNRQMFAAVNPSVNNGTAITSVNLYRIDQGSLSVQGDPINDLLLTTEALPLRQWNLGFSGTGIQTSNGDRLTDGDIFRITIGANAVTFEMDLGYRFVVPSTLTAAAIPEGSILTVFDRQLAIQQVFRFNKGGLPDWPNNDIIDIDIAADADALAIRDALVTAINSSSRKTTDIAAVAVPITTSSPASYDLAIIDNLDYASPGSFLTNTPDHSILLGATFPSQIQLLGTPGTTQGSVRIPFSPVVETHGSAAEIAQMIAIAFNAPSTKAQFAVGSFNYTASATANTVRLQLTSANDATTLPLFQAEMLSTSPEFTSNVSNSFLGNVTGIASKGNAIYAVTNLGYFLKFGRPDPNELPTGQIEAASAQLQFLDDASEPVNFQGLTFGPQNVEGGKYASTLFAIDSKGVLWAIGSDDTSATPNFGVLQPVFLDSATHIDTGFSGATGLAMAPGDFNLWHKTDRRGGDAGHGIEITPDGQLNPLTGRVSGGNSFYFGLDTNRNTVQPGNPESPNGDGSNPIGNYRGQLRATNSGVLGSYDVPGGAKGSLISQPFSLANYSPTDKPTLYFNYFLNTSDTDSGNTTNLTNTARDMFRVYISYDGVSWNEIATNNDTRSDGNRMELPSAVSVNGGQYRADNPNFLNQATQQLFDNTGGWRQARIDLGDFAGAVGTNLRLRFDFSTSGSMDVGDITTTGSFLQAVKPIELRDGQLITMLRDPNDPTSIVTFEVDKGYSVQVPASPATNIADGDSFIITGPGGVETFEFDQDGIANDPSATLITIAAADTPSLVANRIATAIAAGNSGVVVEQLNNLVDLRRATLVTLSNSPTGVGLTLLGDAPGTATQVDFSLEVPTSPGSTIVDGESFTITGPFGTETYEFDSNGSQNDLSAIPISYSGASTEADLADQISNVINFFGSTGAVATVETSGVSPTVTYTVKITGATAMTQSASPAVLLNTTPATVVHVTGDSTIDGIDYDSLTAPEDNPAAISANTTAKAVAQAMDRAFSPNDDPVNAIGFFTSAKVDGSRVQIIGRSVEDAGPFVVSAALPGDSFNGRPYGVYGAGRGENRFEGVYIDDIIIGMAERGEMVTNANTTDTSFKDLPIMTNHLPVVRGTYQLEIQRGTEFAKNASAVNVPGIQVTSSINSNDRLTDGITIYASNGAGINDGETFQISDGVNVATFEFDADGIVNSNDHIVVAYTIDDTASTVALAIQNAINAQSVAKVSAGPDPGTWSPGTNRIDLFGAKSVNVQRGLETIDGTAQLAQATSVDTTLSTTHTGVFAGDVVFGQDDYLLTLTASPGDRITLNMNPLSAIGGFNVVLSSDVATNLIPQSVYPGNPTPIGVEIGKATYGSVFDFIVPEKGTGTYTLKLSGSGRARIALALTNTNGMDYKVFSGLKGDSLPVRDQGYSLISENRISNSLNWGIAVTAGAHDTAENGGGPAPGVPANLREPNTQRLVSGISLSNNLLVGNRTGGIRFDGDPLGAPSAVPFGRIVNNTIYGSGTTLGTGISVGAFASPTILNNILANTATAVAVNANAATTVLGYNLYQGNVTAYTGPAGVKSNESAAINLAIADPLFVNALNGDFYLKSGSLAIDSALDSLQDRPAISSVGAPLGIGPSSILAPDIDLLGQQRIDDATNGSGNGQNVFKDRGAIDRVDFFGPNAALAYPVDNDAAGLDKNQNNNIVKLQGQAVTNFAVQLDDPNGSGIDDSLAGNSANYTITRDLGNGTGLLTLTAGVDYLFSYDAVNNIARFDAAEGVWSEATYTITLNRTGPTVSNPLAIPAIADLAGNALNPNNLSTNTTSFTITLAPAGSSWKNPNNPFDVNASGTVTPLDVLLIINQINLGNLGALSQSQSGPPFYDVNGDFQLTPLDALLVINYLNLQGNSLLIANSLVVTPMGTIDAAPSGSLAVPAASLNLSQPLVANSLSVSSNLSAAPLAPLNAASQAAVWSGVDVNTTTTASSQDDLLTQLATDRAGHDDYSLEEVWGDEALLEVL